MRVFYAAAMAVGLIASSMASAEDFPPIGNRYDTIPEDAKAALKSLKALNARTEIGINFVDYNKAVSEIYPVAKAFLESPDAKRMPELCFVLGNAMDCYLKLRGLWATKVTSDDPNEVYEASVTMITAQPWLWRVAAANVAGVAAIVESPKQDLPKVQQSIAEGRGKLTVESAMKAAAEEAIALSRESRANESGCRVPPKVADDNRHDLAALVFQKGDYPDAFACGPMDGMLPPIFDRVPPATEEGGAKLEINGRNRGRIALLLYDDVDTAKKAYDVLSKGLGQRRAKVPRLGNTSERSERFLVFRRNAAVVHICADFEPFDEVIDGLRKVDARLRSGGDTTAAALDEDGGNHGGAHEFDLRAMTELAERMSKEGGDKSRYAKILLTLVETKTWQRRGEEEPFAGEIISISPAGAIFETPDGRITIRVQDIAGASGEKVVRLRETCRKLQSLAK